jgi:L-lactate dehydrogenase (cytochrome)
VFRKQSLAADVTTTKQELTPSAISPEPLTAASAGAAARRKAARPRVLRRVLALDDFEHAARGIIPRPIFGYVTGGVETNASLRANRAVWDEIAFVPRTLVDTSGRTHKATVFGRTYDAPFGIAPMGGTAMAAYQGDLVLARAAAAANVPMILSGASLTPLERVRDAGPTAWFQAYLPGDEARITQLVERVTRAGYETLVLTVDVQVAANRENNVRSGFSTPLRPSLRLAWDGIIRPRWLFGMLLRTLWLHGMPHYENMGRRVPLISRSAEREAGRRDTLSWKHVELIRRLWRGRFVLKGILDREDARMARESGVDGVIVSNHGGRQLDGTVTPLRVLPEIAAQAGGMTVMMDSGVRRGTDVLKALALGAQFVFIGRPFLFAAAVAGEAGVGHAIALLREEIDRDMALLGIKELAEMRRELLTTARRSGFLNN